MNAFAWIAQFAQDLRFGARSLAQARVFTAIAIGSLALGIGGSTAMYSVLHAVIIDPFPYKDPEHLMSVSVRGQRGGNGSYYTIDQFLEIARRNTVFSGVIASTWSDVTMKDSGEPQRLRGNHCTMNTFEVMGVPPLIGRATAPSDEAETAEPVVLLGYKFWQRQFGGDPGVLGRKLRLNDKTRTIIGVMPQRFMWRGADVYLPDVLRAGQTLEGEDNVHLMARLKPGITREQAAAALRPIFEDLQHKTPDEFPKEWRLRLQSFGETFPSGIQDELWILFGAVGLLLLIACVNVSNLLLSRGAYRRREIAIRAAMGAGRFRIVRQLLAESVVLALGGAAVGVILAFACLRGILAVIPPNTIPDEAEISLNAPVLLFSLAVSLAVSLLFGLTPALHLAGGDLLKPLKEAGRGLSGGLRQKWMRSALVVAEVALSLVLLVGASLMIRTLLSIQGADLSFRPDRILTLRIPFSEQRYPDAERRNAFLQDVLRRMKSAPGVLAVGINSGLPPVYNWSAPIEAVGRPQQESRPVLLQQINADYPRVVGLRLAQGRFPTETEIGLRTHSITVNKTLARQYFPEGKAVGQLIRIPRMRSAPVNLADDSFQIVGVVDDIVNRASSNEIWPELYMPYTITAGADRIFALGAGSPAALAAGLKAQVYAVDPGQPLMDVKSMETLLAENVYARPRFNLILLTVFAVLGLVLALFGIYGVISNVVAQQTREIGIRIALGATFRQVISMVLGIGVRLLAAGVVVGLAASLASVKLLSGLVRNVSTFDPYSFVGVTLLLFAAGLFASFWPARRAARVDPMTVLRDQ
ncbi:ABC transporter permease [uncultured Paludibaculum sp.]|uniref:ABC transporter permease n=1 Tax=uncultured Paludibaculum sp. TaxID=1765020 RepID=UPI002AAB86B9|nr:ABC transporter permease [uncultured Paludibaculum sp.]